MPGWALWGALMAVAWTLVTAVAAFLVARVIGSHTPTAQTDGRAAAADGAAPSVALPRPFELPPEAEHPQVSAGERRRILVVDDDAGLRLLLRATLASDEFEVEEAVSAEEAADLARFVRPHVVVLDIGLPGMDGLTFCRELKRNPTYNAPQVVLLTGMETTRDEIEHAGPDAVLGKPFSPLELMTLVDRMSEPVLDPVHEPPADDAEQLLLYARDVSRLLMNERAHRRRLEHGYRQTATALADALEAKDSVTGLHAFRVQRYALELAGALDRTLLDDPSLEYGFLLHDVGKIGIPDSILQKPGPLTSGERRLMQTHTLLGVAILANIASLQGEGLKVVRSHHERWDGSGYPDGLAGPEIPTAARIFALVDALDAMTSERPYRRAVTWEAAADEILVQSGSQFDPRVVAAFAAREVRMRRISRDLAEHAA